MGRSVMKLSFFISYSRRDEHLVYRYADDIKTHLNVTTWLDKDDIPTGADWWDGICDGIRNCDFFMFFLSPHSAGSKYCMAELGYAHALNKVVLPIMIAETEPLPDNVADIQIYDLVHYKDSRDVLLSLSKDIFHHLQHPRTMNDIAPPPNPDDNVSSAVSNLKPTITRIINPRKVFQQGNDAMNSGHFTQARDLFQQVVQGRNKVLARKSKKLLEQVELLIPLQEASNALTEILSALDDGFITQTEAEEEYTNFLHEYSDYDYPPKLKDVQAEPYQSAYHWILQAQYERILEIELDNLYLEYLPPEIGLLPQLTTLSLFNNKLIFLPTSVGNLSQLRELKLEQNQLVKLPKCIGNLTQVSLLALDNNPLTSVPSWIGNFGKLTWLDLGNTQLTSVPEWIRNLIELEALFLNDNQLENVPEWIGDLTKLEILSLHNVQLGSLPESVGNLVKLTELELSHNELIELPKSIASLSALTSLSLSNNLLPSIPTTIGLLPNLKYLEVIRNPLFNVPDHIEQSDEAILAWLQDEAHKL